MSLPNEAGATLHGERRRAARGASTRASFAAPRSEIDADSEDQHAAHGVQGISVDGSRSPRAAADDVADQGRARSETEGEQHELDESGRRGGSCR